MARTDQASGVSSGAARFKIMNPSVRLHLTVLAFPRPNQIGAGDGGGTHDYTNENWQLTTVAQGTPPIPLNDVFVDPSTGLAAPAQLPDSYEVESGIKEIDGVLNLQSNGNPHESWYITCIWEPAPGGERMTETEWTELIALCQLVPGASPLRLSC